MRTGNWLTVAQAEQLLNAPATMTVLTEDLLAAAPGQSVTDLLRLVPGLNSIQTSARDVNVTSRGATSTLSDSMLVLLDGRSIYQDFFGSVLCTNARICSRVGSEPVYSS